MAEKSKKNGNIGIVIRRALGHDIPCVRGEEAGIHLSVYERTEETPVSLSLHVPCNKHPAYLTGP